MTERDMSQAPSIKNPQIEPNDHIYVLLQDHGPGNGGWGPAAVSAFDLQPFPIIYTGTDQGTIDAILEFTHDIWAKTGKPTKLVKFTKMEEIVSWE